MTLSTAICVSDPVQEASSIPALRERVRLLMLEKRYAESLPFQAALDRLLPGAEKDFTHLFNYGYALNVSGHYAASLPVLDEAIRRFPGVAELHACRSNALRMLGRWREMLDDQRRAWELAPENGKIRYALGIQEMMVSGLREGFDHYAFRTHSALADETPLDLPHWRGEPLAGRRLLVVAEQGVGDMAMWAGLLPGLARLPSVGRWEALGLAIAKKLYPLFARSFPALEVMPLVRDLQGAAAGRYDVCLKMGELMRHVLPSYLPARHPPYLKACEARAAVLRAKYLALRPGTRRLVGISWHTANALSALWRNIPLAQWGELLAVPGVQFVSLQYGDHREEIAAAHARHGGAIHLDETVDAFADMEGLAAQIAAMDEVITIQNATAHFAGALGVKTTLLLATASDWRWGVEREDNLWYRGVRILRQREPLRWEEVMARAAERLKAGFPS